MKILAVAILSSFIFSNTIWLTDFEDAKKTAQQNHKFILINFSGSDWCGPCIRLHAEIFETDVFKTFANENLLLVNADFPRLKKNQLSKAQQIQNEKLADTYNSTGIFPLTVLLNSDGKVVKKWEGLPKQNAILFTEEIKQTINAAN